MRFLIVLVFLSSMIMSCDNATTEDNKEVSFGDTSYVFGDVDYKLPQLSTAVKEQTTSWTALEDFLYEVKKVNGSNHEKLRNHSKLLSDYSTSLFKDVPDTLSNNQINSRLVVLETRSKLLLQVAHQSRLDTSAIQTTVKELNIAVEYFINQLNEKIQKDRIDLQRIESEEQELRSQKTIVNPIDKAESEE